MKPCVINNKKILTEYLIQWVERGTKFKIKSMELEINDNSLWKNEKEED